MLGPPPPPAGPQGAVSKAGDRVQGWIGCDCSLLDLGEYLPFAWKPTGTTGTPPKGFGEACTVLKGAIRGTEDSLERTPDPPTTSAPWTRAWAPDKPTGHPNPAVCNCYFYALASMFLWKLQFALASGQSLSPVGVRKTCGQCAAGSGGLFRTPGSAGFSSWLGGGPWCQGLWGNSSD